MYKKGGVYEMQHYFIGVKLPSELSQQLVNTRNDWQLEKTHKRLPSVEDLHITLVYLGAVESEKLKTLMLELDDNESFASMKLTICGVSTFGNPTTPRVIYAAIEEHPKFSELQSTILEKCLDLSLPVDSKKFVPHITLAKKWSGQQEGFSKEMHIATSKFKVNQFSVYSINPGVTPSYQAIHTIYLKD